MNVYKIGYFNRKVLARLNFWMWRAKFFLSCVCFILCLNKTTNVFLCQHFYICWRQDYFTHVSFFSSWQWGHPASHYQQEAVESHLPETMSCSVSVFSLFGFVLLVLLALKIQGKYVMCIFVFLDNSSIQRIQLGKLSSHILFPLQLTTIL